jgi:hypothetical protein
MFNSNGDFVDGPPDAISETDCTFTITPKNSDERIWVSAPWLSIDMYSNYMTELTSDMSSCGNTYLSINGVKNCGYGHFETYVQIAAPGESVEFELKAPNGQDVHFGPNGLIIFTGTEMPTVPTPPPYTPPSTTYSPYIPLSPYTDSPPTFVNAGSLNHNADICAGNFKYTATGYGSIE